MEDGKSTNTIQSYVGDITAFLKYLGTMGVEFDGVLKRFYVTSYKNYLVDNSYEPATINKKVNSIQAFNNFLIAKGYMQENVIDLKKDRVKIASGSEHQVEVYTDNQLERIQFYIQNSKKVSLRDKMIIQILMFTGVRVSELCDINLKNIDFLLSQIKIIGKGGKVREVPVKFEVMDTIQEYISERNNNPYKDSEYLILGQRGAIQRDAVNTLLEKHTVSGNFEMKLKPHTFRHTFCTRLVTKGIPITTVSKLAGHSSIETTAKFYINSSKEEKMRAVSLL
ncbi:MULTISPECIES: tyrosine-type recombinase/integrase [unclassified Clostridium]|uniref:tyrosine-type recombinase/integrase n=1 Tax=unclassified Clostridium TaxID=2614128 RepID=UPI00054CE241|nr:MULTISPECIES: tyrosine-type recombinase/integrase [unclassified Clostridium]